MSTTSSHINEKQSFKLCN